MAESLQLSEFNALISLLDEPDELLYSEIELNLIQGGMPYISHLEELLGNTLDSATYARIQFIIHNIRINEVFVQLGRWIREGGNNVLEAFLYISKLEQPLMNYEKVHQDLSRLQHDVWLEMNENLTAIEQIKVLNQVFFLNHQFKGVAPKDLSPAHFCLSNILETKCGSPIGLGIIYMHIAQSLKIPVFGVNLASNFLLAYTESYTQTLKLLPSGKVLFYINPNKEGVMFTEEEIKLFVLHHQLHNQVSNYTPISNYLVIFRLINDLMSVHPENIKSEILKTLLDLFSE